MRAFGHFSSCGTVATFCATVQCGNSPTDWIAYPMRRRSASGENWRISSPAKRISPASCSTSRLIILSVVDLPEPEVPISTENAPSANVRLKSFTAVPPL